jgi:hypothetical protein
MKPWLNNAVQQTRPSRVACDRSIPRAGSLSLGRYGVFPKWLWLEFGEVCRPDEARGGSISKASVSDEQRSRDGKQPKGRPNALGKHSVV